MSKPLFVVAGVGNGSGTGGYAARQFAKAGYAIALISRGADSLNKLADEIKSDGGDAAAFPISSYAPSEIASAFEKLSSTFTSQKYTLRVALFNAGSAVWKPFLEITDEELRDILTNNVEAAFTFSRQSILRFKENDLAENGARGTLIFTGATASIRGNVVTSAFSAGKHGVRALSQSLAKEFGKQNIHVSHAIIDGAILTDSVRSRSKDRPDLETNEDSRLDPKAIADTYLHLANQHRSSWTWEIDLRPAHEKW